MARSGSQCKRGRSMVSLLLSAGRSASSSLNNNNISQFLSWPKTGARCALEPVETSVSPSSNGLTHLHHLFSRSTVPNLIEIWDSTRIRTGNLLIEWTMVANDTSFDLEQLQGSKRLIFIAVIYNFTFRQERERWNLSSRLMDSSVVCEQLQLLRSEPEAVTWGRLKWS